MSCAREQVLRVKETIAESANYRRSNQLHTYQEDKERVEVMVQDRCDCLMVENGSETSIDANTQLEVRPHSAPSLDKSWEEVGVSGVITLDQLRELMGQE